MSARRSHTDAAFCDCCGNRIIWATTEAGKRQALDPHPNALGSVIAYHDVAGWQARSVATGLERRHPLEKTYMPHAATCTGKTDDADTDPEDDQP